MHPISYFQSNKQIINCSSLFVYSNAAHRSGLVSDNARSQIEWYPCR